jgi:hypothetical protein
MVKDALEKSHLKEVEGQREGEEQEDQDAR